MSILYGYTQSRGCRRRKINERHEHQQATSLKITKVEAALVWS